MKPRTTCSRRSQPCPGPFIVGIAAVSRCVRSWFIRRRWQRRQYGAAPAWDDRRRGNERRGGTRAPLARHGRGHAGRRQRLVGAARAAAAAEERRSWRCWWGRTRRGRRRGSVCGNRRFVRRRRLDGPGGMCNGATGAAFAPITDYTARDGGFGPAVVTRNTGDSALGTDKVAIFRPAAAKYGQGGVTHPIIVWGNGHTNTVDIWQSFLSRVATYGFVVVAPEQTEVTAAQMNAAIDYVAALGERSGERRLRQDRHDEDRFDRIFAEAAAARSPSGATRASRPRSSSRRTATSRT